MSLTSIKTVKIIGAGSIGNHLAHASRTLGCDVIVTDVSQAALDRMRTEIYPSRYGAWDDGIRLCAPGTAPRGGFDLICIGTPPEFHNALALESLAEGPKAVQIEKPLCTPSLDGLAELVAAAAASPARVFVGYDHVVGRAAGHLGELLSQGVIGDIATFDVEFREHWGGIFRAHPWLDGPADSYLGFSAKGGGASGEHSHALNFWQHLAAVLGVGPVTQVDARLHFVRAGAAYYDDLCLLTLETKAGLIGRVVQDVVAQPVKKEAVVHGARGTLRWINGYSPSGDAVIVAETGKEPRVQEFPKRRPDDFIEELRHIDAALQPGAPESPMSLRRGTETMLVLAAAHESERSGRRTAVDYDILAAAGKGR